jgi:two-component system, OmpR family, response regulator ChvI
MRIASDDNVLNAAAALSVGLQATHKPEPVRVSLLTNAGLGENVQERLLDQGYAVQVLDDASLRDPAAIDIDADIVVIDRSLLGLSSLKAMAQLRFQGVNAPVVFINGLASLMKQPNYSSDVIRDWHGVDSLASALKLATTCTGADKAVPAEEQLICGKLLLQRNGSRAFWDGTDADLTIGEYRIVDLLASKSGQHFTNRAIYDRLRHEGFVAGEGPKGYWANVRSAIKRLRSKFRALDHTFDEIENYPGFGYRWRKPD